MNGRATIVVNGEEVSFAHRRGRRLLDFLREDLSLTGVKEACGEGECGACSVLVDGEPMCSCLLLTDVVAGREVTTVEGVDEALKDAFADAIERLGGVQCGFCTPGFVVMAQWLVRSRPDDPPSKLLEGNLCRCTGYAQLERVLAEIAEGGSDAAGR